MENIQPTDLIQDEINIILNLWKEKHPKSKVWFNTLNSLVAPIKFIIHSIDYFVNVIESKIPDGATKKMTVMTAIGILYTQIVVPLLPIYLKPISWAVRALTLNAVNLLIDFIVTKYNGGNWNKKIDVVNFM